MKTLNNIISKNILKGELNKLYTDGLPTGLNTNLENLDSIFRLDKGKLITVTGIPNMGKSEFIDFLCVQYNKVHGLKTLYFSPENQPIALHLSKLVSKYTNTHFSSDSISESEYNKTIDYISDNFYFMNYETVFNLDVILEETQNLINSEKIDVLVIDSYNKLEAQKEFSVSETDYISKVLDTLERFAKKNNILLFLIAHPRKMQKDTGGNYVIPSPYDINGSANFFNKSDYCLTVHRDYLNNSTIIKIDKVKFKNYGSVGETNLGYDVASGNYFDIDVNICEFDKDENVIKEYKPYNFSIPEIETKTTINYLNTEINTFKSIKDVTPNKYTLGDVLFSDKFNEEKIKVDRVRNEKDIDRKKVLKGCLMNYTVSCTFNGLRDGKNVDRINPLICLDIDKKDNENIINKVPDILKNLDNVLYYSKSCSGQGYFCIIPIQYPERFLEHWQSINNDFTKMGITLDKACKDVTRVRYYSYDTDYYYNPNAGVYSRLEASNKEKERTKPERDNKSGNQSKQRANKYVIKNSDDYKKLKQLYKDCEKENINLSDSYNNWLTIAMGLLSQFGEDGLELFNDFSSLSDKYNEDETNDFYNDLLDKYEDSNDITINSIFYLYNQLKSN